MGLLASISPSPRSLLWDKLLLIIFAHQGPGMDAAEHHTTSLHNVERPLTSYQITWQSCDVHKSPPKKKCECSFWEEGSSKLSHRVRSVSSSKAAEEGDWPSYSCKVWALAIPRSLQLPMMRLVEEVCYTPICSPVLYLLSLSVNNEKVLARIEEAFRRNASASGYLPQATFVREVVGDAVPEKLSEVSGCGFRKGKGIPLDLNPSVNWGGVVAGKVSLVCGYV